MPEDELDELEELEELLDEELEDELEELDEELELLLELEEELEDPPGALCPPQPENTTHIASDTLKAIALLMVQILFVVAILPAAWVIVRPFYKPAARKMRRS